MTEIVAADIGGTNARFAIATVADGRVVELGEPVTLKVAEFASLKDAWVAFREQIGRPLPRAAGIAVASPVAGDVIRMTNSSWVIRPSLMGERLGIEAPVLVNDFGAVAHAVGQLPAEHFTRLCGPDAPLPDDGVTTVCGPGTGLGVGAVLRRDGRYHAIETEGGHIDYAPLDTVEDAILGRLRRTHTRVSAERVCSGPGIVAIHDALADIEGRPSPGCEDRAIWAAALAGTDPLAVAALDRFCLVLGAVAGDMALAHGARGVVIAGGLGYRIKDRLLRSGFEERFVAKGRFRAMMGAIPVKLITHPQPGLFGAAAAFAQRHQ